MSLELTSWNENPAYIHMICPSCQEPELFTEGKHCSCGMPYCRADLIMERRKNARVDFYLSKPEFEPFEMESIYTC